MDSTFYETIRSFVVAQGAPQPVPEIVDFMEGVSRWDFALSARAADVLVDAAASGYGGLDLATLVDGAVVSYLATGQVEAAQRVQEQLGSSTDRGPDDFRTLLLEAYLARGLLAPASP